jgi:cellulose biosynthesis protein BcsQ
VVESSTHRQDIFTYDKNCAAAEDYLNLSKEVING